jgi:hypothetical protein
MIALGVYPLTICKRLLIDLKESSLDFFNNQFNRIWLKNSFSNSLKKELRKLYCIIYQALLSLHQLPLSLPLNIKQSFKHTSPVVVNHYWIVL